MTFLCQVTTEGMEGDGMVAIVQGLRDAGLAVTLTNRKYLQNAAGYNSTSHSPVSIKMSPAETCTEQALSKNVGSMIQDAQYTSTYQLAHCNVRPSSPPQRLTEYPIRRPTDTDISRNQGNFQISGEYMSPGPSYSSQHYRGSLCSDRDSFSFGHISPTPSCKESEAFVNSLRRYPISTSPERSVSIDLVEKLLSFTQNKHCPKIIDKNSNLGIREESPTRDQKTDTKSCKNVQTYSRARKPKKDNGANTNNEIAFNIEKRRFSTSRSPYSLRTSGDISSYDYLKASRRCIRHPEVRYLSDVRKCIKETIKQMCDTPPVAVCPQISSRYSQHKRKHHKTNPNTSPGIQTDDAQASVSNDHGAYGALGQPSFEIPSCSKIKSCCFCRRPIPCACRRGPSMEIPHAVRGMPPRQPDKTADRISAICACKVGDKKSDSRTEDEISKWLKDLPVYADESPENKKQREEMIKDLARKLKSLEGDNNYEDIAKEEIKKCIDKLPIWYPGAKRDQEKFKNQIADNLVNILTTRTDNLKDVVAKWLDEVQFEEEADKDKIAQDIVRRLRPLAGQPEEFQSEIEDVLQDFRITNKSKVINKLTNKLVNDLADVTKIGTKNIISKDSIDEEKDYEDLLWDWLEDVVNIPEENKEIHKKLVANLAEKLLQLESKNTDDDVVEEEIENFLVSLADEGVSISPKNKDKFTKQLMNKIKLKPKPRKSFAQGEASAINSAVQQLIYSEISDLVDDIPSNISKGKQKDIKDKIADILANNIDNLSNKTENIQRDIANILKKEAQMRENEASELASAIINRAKGMSLPDQSSSESSLSRLSSDIKNNIKLLVAEEVRDVLNDYNISPNMKREVEKSITKVLVDQIVRGKHNNKTKDEIESILQHVNLSEDDVNDISDRLLEKNKELSLSYKTRDSNLISKDGRSQSITMSPMEREEFEEKAEWEILDFIEEVTDDDSLKARKKRKEATNDLVPKLGAIISNPNISDTDKDKTMIDELTEFFKNLSLDRDAPRDDLARQLAKRIKHVTFQTSTPRKENFEPKRITTDISSIRLNDDSVTKGLTSQVPSNEEKQYTNELKEVIQSWMGKLSIDLSAIEDKGLKETMIQDLAGDIVDRQKYLQINPDAKSSDQEELEHLKYQMFRWLNKLLEPEELSLIMQKTEMLMMKIKDVNVPNLVNSSQKPAYHASPRSLRDSLDLLKDKISKWMEEIPKELYVSADKNFKTQMINELAERIRHSIVNKQIGNIPEEIKDWMSQLIKDADKQLLTEMTEDLKVRLKRTSESSFRLSQDSSEFIEENLIGGIRDWLTKLALYQIRTLNEKRELERIIPDLANGFKSVFESAQTSKTNADDQFINEIVKHLKQIPTGPEDKSAEQLLRRMAVQLLHYLKGLQLFQDISDRQEILLDEYLMANLDEWVSTLPLARMNSAEMIQFENLKKEFASRVKKIREEEPKNVQKLKNEIRNSLIKFPIEEHLIQNQKFINDRVEDLFRNLLTVPIEAELKDGELVRTATDKWIRTLSLEKPKTVDDIPSKAIVELASNVTSVIDKTDLVDDIKKILEELIEKFLQSVPLDPNIDYDIKKLASDMYNEVKLTSRMPPAIKNTADILFENIENWCDSLPLKGDTLEEIEKDAKVKKEIASKLIHKIGELNMNPEVINDDFLYNEMLEDEIDNLLTDLSSEDIKNNLPTIKKNLMEKIKEARQKTQEDVSGQAYKQQLREAVSKTLPSQSFTDEEQATFEVLKDSLADAFINLHYVGSDEELKNKYKNKITEEVSKFCNDYLKKHPSSPLDSKKLNQDLYNALKGVSIPKEETVRTEVEISKIKDEVNDWIKELPLKRQTPAEKLQTNKMIAVLGKKIHDIERQKELNPSIDYDDIMKKEITKLLKKLSLNIDEAEIPVITERLIKNLKKTGESRRVSASKRHSIEPEFFETKRSSKIETKRSSNIEKNETRRSSNIETRRSSNIETKRSSIQSTCNPSCTGVCRSQYTVPPSSLSFEELEHLDMIRVRSPLTRIRCPLTRDASVSPFPVDTGSQTEIQAWDLCPSVCEKLAQQMSAVQTQSSEQKQMQAVGSQAEVCPQIIVKEYYWDSTDPSRIVGVCPPCPSPLIGQFTPGPCSQINPSPCSQNTPGPYSQVASGPCSQATPGPSTQSTPEPCTQFTPGPCSQATPGPCNQATLGPCTQFTPGPCTQPTPGPYTQATPGPYAQATTGPCTRVTPGPWTQATPGPCTRVTPGPCTRVTSGPCTEGTSGPCPQISPGPCTRFTPVTSAQDQLPPCLRTEQFQRPIPQRPSILSQEISSPRTQLSTSGPYYTPPTPQARRTRKEWDTCRPGLSSDEIIEPGTSRYCRASKVRITRLGSFDDMKPRCNRPSWKFPEDDAFWKDCRNLEEEVLCKEVKCQCRGKSSTKGAGKKRAKGSQVNDIKQCPKCCGVRCPYPSFMYFRQ